MNDIYTAPAQHVLRKGRVTSIGRLRADLEHELTCEWTTNTPELVRLYLDATGDPDANLADTVDEYMSAAYEHLIPQDGGTDCTAFGNQILGHFYGVLDSLRDEIAERGLIEWSRYE